MTGKRPKPGDILEVVAPNGLIYAHYLGKHPEYGDAIVVCPAIQSTAATIGPELFEGGYVTFYPVTASASRGFSSVVGHLPAPGIPKRFRRPGAIYGRIVTTWIIEESSKETVKETLSEEELALPIAAIWNHELLVQRVSEGWRPETEGRHE